MPGVWQWFSTKGATSEAMYSSYMRLHVAAVPGVRALVVPGLVVHGVHAEDLHPPGLDVMGEGVDHPLPLVLALVAAAGREARSGGP